MTLSTPMKVIALAGLALILGLGGVVLLVGHKHAATTTPPPQVHVVQVTPPVHQVVKPKPVKPKVQLDSGLPAAVHSKLELSHEVVAFVYTRNSASDRALLAQARAGAHDAHVPFVALDVTNERTAEAVYQWATTVADPVLLVVKRPGRVVLQLNGVLDRLTAAQAASSVR